MKLIDTIDKIINLPSDFLNSINISAYELLKAAGYFANHMQISKDDIITQLYKHPNAVDEWLEWSSNKRVDSGWYFNKEASLYIVGYYPNKGNEQLESYSDPNEACAAFIKHEVENIRKS